MRYQGTLSVLFLALLAGCGSGPQGDPGATGAQGAQGGQGPAGPQGPAASPSPTVDSSIEAIVDAYPTNLNPGINCTVQAVTSGGFLSTSSPGYVAANCTAAPLSAACALALSGAAEPYTNMNGFDQVNASSGSNSVVADDLQYLLTKWGNYKVSCPSGYLVLTEAGFYDFDVQSDDGAILSITGTVGLSANYSLNNDGQHGITEKATTAGSYLVPGVYNFNLQYSQSGGGAFALIVSYIHNGTMSVIPAANFYH